MYLFRNIDSGKKSNLIVIIIRNRRKGQNSDSIEGITLNTVTLALIANILNRVGDI
jgi:hypothetical protein